MQSPESEAPIPNLHEHLRGMSPNGTPLKLVSTDEKNDYDIWVGFINPEDTQSPVSLAIRRAAQANGRPSDMFSVRHDGDVADLNPMYEGPLFMPSDSDQFRRVASIILSARRHVS